MNIDQEAKLSPLCDFKDLRLGRLERSLRELQLKLDNGVPLTPFDFTLYATYILKGAHRFSEPGCGKSERFAAKLGESFKELVGNREKHAFGPRHGWDVVFELAGWSELADMWGGWGSGHELGPDALKLIEVRTKEIEQYNEFGGISREVVDLREKHIMSLWRTYDVITSPDYTNRNSSVI